MTLVRRLGAVTSLLIPLFVGGIIIACRGEKERPPVAAPGAPPPAPAGVEAPDDISSEVQWDAAAGRALVLSMGTTQDSAMIVRPEYVDGFNGWRPEELRPLARSRWDLFGRSGAFGSAQLEPTTTPASADGCTTWPTAKLPASRAGWRTALEAGRATAIPLDSVEALSSADSARFVVEVTQLAAATRGPDDSLFASIPFVVRYAYRFRTGDIEGVIASLQRSIHSEADPREEHLFLVAERPVGSTAPYRVSYTTRAAGAEGGAPVTDVLAAVSLVATGRIVLVASHEYEDGGEIWWIERTAPGRWAATWRSAATGC